MQLAKKDFPLCMQHLHQNMRANHHLRHHGRQQYGLFLKGIGLTLEEAMRFWKTEFTKIIDGDKVCLLNDLQFVMFWGVCVCKLEVLDGQWCYCVEETLTCMFT